MHTQ
jgi:hypothetical protein